MTVPKVLIANRGEIARRIIRTCRAMGLPTVAVCSEADRRALHVLEADEAVVLGPAPVASSYLAVDRILEAARRTHSALIHPGYGFLSENAKFAAAVEASGFTFVGPTPETLATMGDKRRAKQLAMRLGVPVVPGWEGAEAAEDADAIQAAERVGFPLLVKAVAGGGGRGMRVVHTAEALPQALVAARREAEAAFGDGGLLLERLIARPRHIEVQIFGDSIGNILHLGERECSLQRRHQKVFEEAPAPRLDPALREQLCQHAVAIGRAVGYRSAGTVEFIVAPGGAAYFLEVNTRLQVEHPVTEAVTGLDLVRLQLEVALGKALPLTQEAVVMRGHAIEARLCAEDPERAFMPQTGELSVWDIPESEGVRIDSGVNAGTVIGVHYDSLLAKVIAWGEDRAMATARLGRALDEAVVVGVRTNLGFLRRVVRHPAWQAAELHTEFLEERAAEWVETRDEAGLERAARVATALWCAALQEGARPLPELPLGWRNHRAGPAEVVWEVDEQRVVVRYRVAEGGRVWTAIGDEAVEIELCPRGEGGLWAWVGAAGSRLKSSVISGGWVLHWPGEAAVTVRREVVLARPQPKGAIGGLVAPMPGKVVDVRVVAGEWVEAEAVLVVLEAMKMEQRVQAAQAGWVQQVLVAVGEGVEAGQELVIVSGEAREDAG